MNGSAPRRERNFRHRKARRRFVCGGKLASDVRTTDQEAHSRSIWLEWNFCILKRRVSEGLPAGTKVKPSKEDPLQREWCKVDANP